MKVPRYQLTLIFVASTVALVAHCALARLSATLSRASEPIATQDVASMVPAAGTLRFLALGHNEALADVVWLNALSFFGAHFGLRKDPTWLNPHLDAMNGLDPNFALAYSWAGTAIMYGGEINNESVAASSAVLERGVERFPYAWDLAFMLGVNYYFEMQPTNAEERQQWRAYGAEMIARAAALPNAPSYIAPAATALLAAQGSSHAAYEVAVRALSWADTEQQRNSYRSTIARRGSLDALATFDQRQQRVSAAIEYPPLPTVPPSLVVVLHLDPALAALPDSSPSILNSSEVSP